ncbi:MULTISPECIES: ABC transporter permease [unclassified Acetobacterium]|jgi:ABC-2 type transport system permease protein|uniref:ABC transporter permease n=1 Tax=unclassified Acetobacterium TaxID=2638182 RepID=UPI000DBECA31|nr:MULTISPECIES: ABC transporter permease [unclassified Acetobacterium]AWW27737.1 ABC transporter permease [Acetobacterium sp. KB-1]MDZ5725945.1 ABC transporter permease [Acetobacterium sp. K1/6]
MQVYKAFFKVIKKNRGLLLIYLVVFMVLALLLTNTYNPPQDTDFSKVKVNIAFINDDNDSLLVAGLKTYLSENANLVDLPDEPQKLQDALFFRQVEYILRVPDGFTEAMLSGREVQLEKTIVPDSTSNVYMDLLINKYLNTAQTYITYMPGLSQAELTQYLDKDLAEQSQVTMISNGSHSANAEKSGYYFNYLSYSMFAILILGVCSVMLVFNNTDLKRRNLCSPIRSANMNFQMILGNLSFAILTWLVLISASFVMYGSFMFTANGLLLLLNSFVFTLAALSISYLIANLVKSRGAMSAVANVFALGTSFISGVFVPQELLGANVLTIASFTPTYWYIKANNEIAAAVSFNANNLQSIFTSMVLVLAFGVAVLGVTLVLIKQRRVEG